MTEPKMDDTPAFCVGAWLPSDEASFARWMEGLGQTVTRPLHPTVQAFKDGVLADPALFALANQMFEQIPDGEAFSKDPTGQPQSRSFARVLHMINAVLTTPPFFNKSGLTGLPINAMIDWSLGTTSGYVFFLDATVNRHLKAILCAWGAFLTTSDSLPALSDDPRTGWFGEDAMANMPDFDAEFECTPDLPYRGFTSWDNFFTRRFRQGRRPVAAPEDDSVIVNACEAAPFRLARDVQLLDRFWIKAQPYSLQHMLAGDERTPQFDGGTVYQAFLSSFSYHRWHSPVTGRIVKTQVVDGTYYAQNQHEGFDPCAPRQSQAYITQLATRALIFIEADHPGIGLMCFMAVGMAEVSTCDVRVSAGQQVSKGDELGMFHFGGSTHCLMFRPEVKLEFDLRGQTPGLDAKNIRINECIARVVD